MAVDAPHPRDTDKRIAMSLKILESQRYLIDRAAAVRGENRTEFMLDSALQAARDTLLDQRLFLLDPEAFDAFEKALDRPTDPARLQALFDRRAPWED